MFTSTRRGTGHSPKQKIAWPLATDLLRMWCAVPEHRAWAKTVHTDYNTACARLDHLILLAIYVRVHWGLYTRTRQGDPPPPTLLKQRQAESGFVVRHMFFCFFVFFCSKSESKFSRPRGCAGVGNLSKISPFFRTHHFQPKTITTRVDFTALEGNFAPLEWCYNAIVWKLKWESPRPPRLNIAVLTFRPTRFWKLTMDRWCKISSKRPNSGNRVVVQNFPQAA